MKLGKAIIFSTKYETCERYNTIIYIIQFDFEIKCAVYILTIRLDSGSKNNKNIAEFHFFCVFDYNIS